MSEQEYDCNIKNLLIFLVDDSQGFSDSMPHRMDFDAEYEEYFNL